MKALPAHPSLYQINTRVWLTELSRALGRPATLDDIPDADLPTVTASGTLKLVDHGHPAFPRRFHD